MGMRSPITELFQKLEAQGKVRYFSLEETEQIRQDINEQMQEFEIEARYKEIKSIEEASKIYIAF